MKKILLVFLPLILIFITACNDSKSEHNYDINQFEFSISTTDNDKTQLISYEIQTVYPENEKIMSSSLEPIVASWVEDRLLDSKKEIKISDVEKDNTLTIIGLISFSSKDLSLNEIDKLNQSDGAFQGFKFQTENGENLRIIYDGSQTQVNKN